jgi:hypothetical protein
LDCGEGHVIAATEKKVKYHGFVCTIMHIFFVKPHPRLKLGLAVACTSVVPV